MFKKLIANLPFNPSLISEVKFYTERLKQERVTRQLSFLFIIAAMFLQMFAVVTPPQKSLATSDNHILNGLTSSKSAQQNKDFVLNAWDDPNSDIRAIYGLFGVTRDDIASMQNTTAKIFTNDGNDYWTTGRNSLLGYSNVAQQYKDTQIAINYNYTTPTGAKSSTVYYRELRAWDIINKNGQDKYGLKGTIKSTGETFWILYDCGNFTKKGEYIPPREHTPPPTPTINAVCSIIGPIIIGKDDTSVNVPVRIGLPAGSIFPAGSPARGLHLGVTTNGNPSTWSKYADSDVASTPPDKQTDYVPTNNNLVGLSYYDFVWDKDGSTYRRYFVTKAQSSDFDVTINVKINKLDKKLVVRLLDREKGSWLPHNSACEVPISRTVPPPPEPIKPAVKIIKTIVDKPSFFKPGDTFTYLIQYRNTVNASRADNVVITDELNLNKFDVVKVVPSDIKVSSTGYMKYELGSLAYTDEYQNIRITVKLKDQISSGDSVCNASKISASNANSDEGSICVGIITPCRFDSSVINENDPNCIEPKLVCELVDTSINRTTRKVIFKTTVTSTNPDKSTVVDYNYNFGDDSPLLAQQAQGFTDEAMHTYEPGNFNAKVTVTYVAEGVSGNQQVECVSPISFEPDKPVGQSKSVKNVTQDKTGQAAIDTKLQANDVLEYTLTTTNPQNYQRAGIEISDYIGDVTDYANLDLDYLAKQGGTYDQTTKKIIWKDISIQANGEVKHTYQVKIKNPVPSTNAPSTVSTTFDCRISNKYGNEITMNVKCPAVKGLETLPNTGPGSSLVAMISITTIVGYFFSRSRLLAREMDLIKTDYATTGGM